MIWPSLRSAAQQLDLD